MRGPRAAAAAEQTGGRRRARPEPVERRDQRERDVPEPAPRRREGYRDVELMTAERQMAVERTISNIRALQLGWHESGKKLKGKERERMRLAMKATWQLHLDCFGSRAVEILAYAATFGSAGLALASILNPASPVTAPTVGVWAGLASINFSNALLMGDVVNGIKQELKERGR